MKIMPFVLSNLICLLSIPGLTRLTKAAPSDPTSPRSRTVEERLEAIEARLRQIEDRVNLTLPGSSAKGDAGVAVSPPAEPLAARFEALDQKVQILESRREQEQKDPAGVGAAAPVVAAGTDGFNLRSNNGDYRLAFGMVAQTDGRFSLDDPKPITNTFTL